MRIGTVLALLVGCVLCTPSSGTAGERPPLMLAEVYDGNVDLTDYWVSEKYDGIRAYWNGHRLLTRGGHVIRAPDWFVAGWPTVPLDGELWAGRGRFAVVAQTVRDELPDDAAWRQIRFMVFDLPAHPGSFTERLAAMRSVLTGASGAHVQLVPQVKVANRRALDAMLRDIVSAGGEGLMLHRGGSLYHAGRTRDLLKLKPHADAEARVIAHVPGKGKYLGLLGALLVERPDGLRFRLGTGFTDEERRHPPPIGSWVTYSYQGFTAGGVPRFARFMRVRDEPPEEDEPQVK